MSTNEQPGGDPSVTQGGRGLDRILDHGGYYILKDHEPVGVDIDEYMAWMQRHKYGPRSVNYKDNPEDLTRVGWTEIEPGIEVSTVFLGLDHGWGDGPPILFETMTFGGPHDGDCERYSTWNEAVVGHERAVRDAKR